MTGPGRRIGAAVAAVAGICAVALLVAALANANTAERVSANASMLHRANATLGSSALVRAAAGQVALFEGLVADGVADQGALDAAEHELNTVIASLTALVGDDGMNDAAGAFLKAVTAHPIDMAAVERTYAPWRGQLVGEVAAAERAIDANETSADRLSVFLRVAVTLLIPIAVIVVYRRRAAAQVRTARADMQRAVDAERTIGRAKSDFVAGLSHEMRTPLTGIYGFSAMLLETVEDDATRDMVKEIHDQSVELTRMIDDFITMSRIDSETIRFTESSIDLPSVAREVAAEVDHIPIDVDGLAPPVVGDRSKTRHILVNLVSNAVRYGGASVRLEVGEEDDFVWCAVIDDGQGVPDDQVDRLFRRFVNEGDAVLVNGSHGLGTWVAATLAERMGGSVRYSRVSDETVFTFRLPKAGDVPGEVPVRSGSLVPA